ncbi:uncharacterized protein BO95DRAFT_227782 [Aspergillus brunneoviolaceus CBS 621.78]|uniref:Uncharacterized protein n=1 Tax=Aspergillus brunneoviolaceus CBS 621.78 TaxID=1450534 RepID=A0ACD1G0N0_9EURO|nr:hypothetical protein BO95DRAFT_227782 [Aspergillus brunneoviolaceus CBS 621.78]RAH42789.1 hypothetical protein BO95DRAFT_227782 [Aspergillus brunneoviolaceus CBS 621.78]
MTTGVQKPMLNGSLQVKTAADYRLGGEGGRDGGGRRHDCEPVREKDKSETNQKGERRGGHGSGNSGNSEKKNTQRQSRQIDRSRKFESGQGRKQAGARSEARPRIEAGGDARGCW